MAHELTTTDSGRILVSAVGTSQDLTAWFGSVVWRTYSSSQTLSGTSVSFTAPFSNVKRITVVYFNLSTSGTSLAALQIGDSGGLETSGYDGVVANTTGQTAWVGTHASFRRTQVAAGTYAGKVELLRVGDLDTWVINSQGARTDAGNKSIAWSSGRKTLTGDLTTIAMKMVNGTDTFDSGTAYIIWEK